MAEAMRAAWGVTSASSSRPKAREADEEQVNNLMEICGPDLTRRGARKLLLDHRGDATSALNAFMDMSPGHKARLNQADAAEAGSAAPTEQQDVGPITTTLPHGWECFKPEIVGWITAQCAALGCDVSLTSADPAPLAVPIAVPAPPQGPGGLSHLKTLLASAEGTNPGLACLQEAAADDDVPGKLQLPRTGGAGEAVGKCRAVSVNVRRGLVQALLYRERQHDSRSQVLKAVEGKLIPLQALRGTVDWQVPQDCGPCPAGSDASCRAARGVVTLKSSTASDSFLVPAVLLSLCNYGNAPRSDVRFAATGASARDAVTPHAVETACSKVLVFDRHGDTVSRRWLAAITETLQNKFLDTQIFVRPQDGGYRFAVCGLGAHWVRHWLLGRLLWQVRDGHAGLRSEALVTMEQKTGCTILLAPQPQENVHKEKAPASWEWLSGSGWTAFGPEEAGALEQAHAGGEAAVTMNIGSRKYVIDLAEMVQVNTESHTRRAVRRVGGTSSQPPSQRGNSASRTPTTGAVRRVMERFPLFDLELGDGEVPADWRGHGGLRDIENTFSGLLDREDGDIDPDTEEGDMHLRDANDDDDDDDDEGDATNDTDADADDDERKLGGVKEEDEAESTLEEDDDGWADRSPSPDGLPAGIPDSMRNVHIDTEDIDEELAAALALSVAEAESATAAVAGDESPSPALAAASAAAREAEEALAAAVAAASGYGDVDDAETGDESSGGSADDDLAAALAASLEAAEGAEAEDEEEEAEPALTPRTPATPQPHEPSLPSTPARADAAAVVTDAGSACSTPARCEEGFMWVAVIGPHNTRKVALALIERERKVREETLRVLPSMQGCISPDEVMVRTGSTAVSHEGPGVVRVVGYPQDIKKARDALEKLVPLWQKAVQRKRLGSVTRDLVTELSRIEVRVPISDRMRQLLSQPVGLHASSCLRKASGSLFERYRVGRQGRRGDEQPDTGKVQVMWVTLDEFATEVSKRMEKHGVPVPKEWTPQGASVGLMIGDTLRSSAQYAATPAMLKGVEGFNAPLCEDGVVLKADSWLNLDPDTQHTTLDVFLRTVDDWLKCTCEQRGADPGRPSLVTLEVEWTVKQQSEVRGHAGMWRQDGLTVNNYWCSGPVARDLPYCLHRGEVRMPHWSCCGERNLQAKCSRPGQSKRIQIGSKVRVNSSVTQPKFKWGTVKPGDVGTVVKIDAESKDKCTVEFASCKRWKAHIPELEFAPLNKQKGVLHNPSLGLLSRVSSEPERFDTLKDVKSADAAVAKSTCRLVNQKWCMLADQYLLSELGRVLSAVVPKDTRSADLRAAHAAMQRSRQRLKEMEKEAEKISSQVIDCLYQVSRGCKKLQGARQQEAEGDEEAEADEKHLEEVVTLVGTLIDTAKENLREWLQEISAADFEAERQLGKLRSWISKKERADRRWRTVWDIIQHISDVSGAFVDYRPPNLHLRVSGNEVNIRAAMQHLRFLGDEGALGLEKTVTVSVKEDVAARLRQNSGVLLQLIQQQAGLYEAKLLADNILELVGTEEQVHNALNSLDIRDQVRTNEYAMSVHAHHTQDWGRQQSAIPASDPKTCCACLAESEEPLYELLCGHTVHSTCLRMWVSSCIERSQGITDSGEIEGPGAEAVCPMTGGGGCTHVLTTREFCDAARLSDGRGGGAHVTLDNLTKRINKRLPTHDKIRSCPQCGEWVVVGSKAEPVLCKGCGHTFCAVRGMPRCGGVAHYFSSCDQFQKARVKMLKRRGKEVPAEIEAVGSMPDNCVPCMRCQSWIMREEDLGQRCRYMVCRECMYEFCWLCLMPAVNHKHVHTADTPAADRAKAPECDPDNRDRRRRELLDKMQEGEVVSVWRDCSTCTRCDAWPIPASSKAFACLQCPNVYLCESCEPQGCTKDCDHVLDELPRVESTMGKPTPPLPAREELDVDEDFWNDVLPNDAAWTCVECDEVCQGDVCQQCGECRVRARSAFCPGGHAMVISATQEGGYKSGWVCTLCDESGKGERWFCALCQADYCYTCSPRPALPSATCTVGHAMKSVPSATGKGVCLGPGCNVSWPGPTARWRCDSCDYDLCGHCYKREVATPQPKKYFLNLIGLRSV